MPLKVGLPSEPDFRNEKGGGYECPPPVRTTDLSGTLSLPIEGMTCRPASAGSKRALKAVPGVADAVEKAGYTVPASFSTPAAASLEVAIEGMACASGVGRKGNQGHSRRHQCHRHLYDRVGDRSGAARPDLSAWLDPARPPPRQDAPRILHDREAPSARHPRCRATDGKQSSQPRACSTPKAAP
jgi:hypothetical protein